MDWVQSLFNGIILLIIGALTGTILKLLTGKIVEQGKRIDKLELEVEPAMAKVKEENSKIFMPRAECSLVHANSAIQMEHIVESVKKLESSQEAMKIDVKKIQKKIDQIGYMLQTVLQSIPGLKDIKIEE